MQQLKFYTNNSQLSLYTHIFSSLHDCWQIQTNQEQLEQFSSINDHFDRASCRTALSAWGHPDTTEKRESAMLSHRHSKVRDHSARFTVPEYRYVFPLGQEQIKAKKCLHIVEKAVEAGATAGLSPYYSHFLGCKRKSLGQEKWQDKPHSSFLAVELP